MEFIKMVILKFASFFKSEHVKNSDLERNTIEGHQQTVGEIINESSKKDSKLHSEHTDYLKELIAISADERDKTLRLIQVLSKKQKAKRLLKFLIKRIFRQPK